MQDESYVRIPLRARDGSIRAHALVDPEYAHLAEHRWYLANGYAVRQSPRVNGRQRHIRMHRVVLGLPPTGQPSADHINRDRLDNRRSNLRIVTHAQNMQNLPAIGGSSTYRGVSWAPDRRKWRAFVRFRDKQYWLGQFDDEKEAAAAASLFRLLFVPCAVERSD